MPLNNIKQIEQLEVELYGTTLKQAHFDGICIKCKQKPEFYSCAGRKEYTISALCEKCFDEITREDE